MLVSEASPARLGCCRRVRHSRRAALSCRVGVLAHPLEARPSSKIWEQEKDVTFRRTMNGNDQDLRLMAAQGRTNQSRRSRFAEEWTRPAFVPMQALGAR